MKFLKSFPVRMLLYIILFRDLKLICISLAVIKFLVFDHCQQDRPPRERETKFYLKCNRKFTV